MCQLHENNEKQHIICIIIKIIYYPYQIGKEKDKKEEEENVERGEKNEFIF